MTDEVEVLREPAPCTLDELRAHALPVLREHGVREAVVFGSWARGEADGYSDLDLAVALPFEGSRGEQRLLLTKALEERLPLAVEVIVYTPEELAEGRQRGLGVFDALAREGVRIL